MKSQHAFAALIVLMSFAACKKYDNGPAFSLRSVKNRLCQKWQPYYFMNDSTGDVSIDSTSDVYYEFDKDGDLNFIFGTNTVLTLNWSFNDDKTAVIMTDGNSSDTWNIQRLTNKEFWFQVFNTGYGM